MKAVGTKLDKTTHEKLKERCDSEGVCMSEYLRTLIMNHLDGSNRTSEHGRNNDDTIPYANHVKLFDNNGNLIWDADIDVKTGKEIPKPTEGRIVEIIKDGSRYDVKGNYLGPDNSAKPLKRVEVML